MNVDMIQKVSNLAEELLTHGMAESKDDACKKAEKMLSKDGNTEMAEMKGTVGGVKFDFTPQEEKSSDPKAESCCDNDNNNKDSSVDKDLRGLDELREIMSKNTSFIVKKFRELDDTIAGLKEEITDLKSSSVVSRSQKIISDNPDKSTAVKEAHPRQGDYKKDDVAVDKIFYYGSK